MKARRLAMLRSRGLGWLALAFVGCAHEPGPTPKTPATADAPARSERDTRSAAPSGAMVPSTAESSDGSPGEPSAPAVVLDDGQVVKIVALANDAAIEQATLARDKAERPRVKKFAQMMIAQHGEAKRKQAKLSARRRLKGSDSELSSELERDAAAALARLEQASGEDVDRAYIDALIESHAKLLRWIDGVLRPNAEHREIVILLEELRPKVLAHLDEGKDVQRWLREPRRRNRASQAR